MKSRSHLTGLTYSKTCLSHFSDPSLQISTPVSTPSTTANACSRPAKAQGGQAVFSSSPTTTSSSLRPWQMASSTCTWSACQPLESTTKLIRTVCLRKFLVFTQSTLSTSRTVTSCWWRTLANLKTKKSFATSSIWKEAWLTGRSKVKLKLGTHSKTKTS